MKYKFLAAMLSVSTAAIAVQVPDAHAQAQSSRQSYNIAAQDLGTALQRYSQISGREVIASSTLVQGKRSARVQGRLSAVASPFRKWPYRRTRRWRARDPRGKRPCRGSRVD